MAPSAAETQTAVPIHTKATAASTTAPIKSSGALDQFKSIELTPVIGREYPTVNLVELLNAPNSDDLLRDLAVTSMSACPQYLAVGTANRISSLPKRCRIFQGPK